MDSYIIKKVFTWDELQKQDGKQTVVIVNYRCDVLRKVRTRILIGHWYSREEAWNWCQDANIRRYAEGPTDGWHVESFRLLRLSKTVRELDETKPRDTSAALIEQ